METGQKAIRQSSNIDIASNRRLSIQVGLNGFSFCILDLFKERILFLDQIVFDKKNTPKQLLADVDAFFKSHSTLHEPFKDVLVLHHNNLSTFVPKPLFDEAHLADYLKFNTKILTTDYLAYDHIDNYDLVNVYVPYVNINNFIFERFGNFVYKHTSTILIKHLINMVKHSEHATMFVHVYKRQFEIVVLNQNKFLLYNSYEYQTKEDFIYYILFTIEQLKLNPETLHLELFGLITEDDNLYKIAYKYIRFTRIMDYKPNYALAKALNHNPLHHYTILNSF